MWITVLFPSLSLDQWCSIVSPVRDIWNWMYLAKHGHLVTCQHPKASCLASSCRSRRARLGRRWSVTSAGLAQHLGCPEASGMAAGVAETTVPRLPSWRSSSLISEDRQRKLALGICCQCAWILGSPSGLPLATIFPCYFSPGRKHMRF